jgi:hypothetical protein
MALSRRDTVTETDADRVNSIKTNDNFEDLAVRLYCFVGLRSTVGQTGAYAFGYFKTSYFGGHY